MNFRPLHDRILIRRIEEKQAEKGGIIIPDSAKEKPQEGEVVAVGGGKKDKDGKVVPLDVKAGDRILFGKYSGTEIKLDNEEYLILREEEVLGILEGKAASVVGRSKSVVRFSVAAEGLISAESRCNEALTKADVNEVLEELNIWQTQSKLYMANRVVRRFSAE